MAHGDRQYEPAVQIRPQGHGKEASALIARYAKRRLLWWALGGVGGCLAPAAGFGFLAFVVVAAFFMVFGGLGYHALRTPPPLPTQAVFSAQWLTLVQHVDTANGFFLRYPAVVWIAAIQAASGGMPLDRTRAGGYGLYDLPQPADMGRPLAATNAFARDLRAHQRPQNLEATLNAVGETLSPPRADWAETVRRNIDALERGPALAAWPVVASWSHTPSSAATARFGPVLDGTAAHWDYPAHTAIRVVAAAAAPVGNPFALNWTPPYTVCTPPPPHSTAQPSCRVATDTLAGRDIAGPTSMTLTTADGRRVPMVPVQGPDATDGFVPPHAVLYVTTRAVVVNRRHPATITARWGSGLSVSTTLPGAGFGASSSGPVGATPPFAPPQTLDQIWAAYGAAVRSAAAATGTPASLLVAEAFVESRGVNYAYAGADQACGVWQMFAPGAFTQYAAPGTPDGACAAPSVEAIAAARYLAALHREFGSWRVALAAYYGGPGTVAGAGARSGMTWAQAAPLLNWAPDPAEGNTETMTAYADAAWAAARAFARAHRLPAP